MAFDVAEFLWNKISKALQDSISEFGGHTLSPNFEAIKTLMNDENKKTLCSLIASESPSDTNSIVEKLAKPSKFAVLYDLDDVLAEFHLFERQCEELHKNLFRFNPVSKYFINVRNKNRLKIIEERLKNLLSKKPTEDETVSRHFPTERQTYPPVNPKVIGFDHYLKEIEGKLINHGFRAFGIHGMAGAGKTTLAQMVFNSPSVAERFKRRIWLCLSDSSSEKDEDLGMKIVKCILEELDYDFDSLASDNSLNELLEELHKKLERERYLIVLDDVWLMNDLYGNMNNCTSGDNSLSTKNCLSDGLPKEGGGVVIVTSRSQEVVKHVVGEVEDNLLDFSRSLNEKSCWELFKYAIKDGGEEGCNDYMLDNIKEEIEYQCHSLPLAAKALAQIVPKQIKDFEKDRILKEFFIRDDILKRGDDSSASTIEIPLCPVLVFLNTVTSGHHGKELFAIFVRHLNKNQVFDLSDSKVNTNEVLHKIYGSIERFPRDSASEIRKKLKILVVGGDVVANGILGVVSDMKLLQSPSIASVPHGSENNIPISFGWGKEPLKADRESVESLLEQIKDDAVDKKTDSWHISIKIKVSIDSVAHEEIPRALHMFQPVVNDEKQIKDKYGALQGGFWNYFKIGVGTPMWSGVGCFSSSTRTFSRLVTVQIKERSSKMKDYPIPSSVRSIFCLNLHRFPGGLNPWDPTSKEEPNVNNQSRVQPSSFIDDELLEIIGSTDGFLPGRRHNIQIAQVEEIHFLIKGTAEHLNINIDGALWERIPVHGIESIKISHFGQINFLATPDCEVKSMPVPDSTAIVDHGHRKGEPKPSEIRRKFGAGTTFKRPDNLSIPGNVNLQPLQREKSKMVVGPKGKKPEWIQDQNIR